jgi:hypothetical protein
MKEQMVPSMVNGKLFDRRRALRAGGLAAGAAALLKMPGPVGAAEPGALEWDVALDGRTFRVVRGDQSNPSALPTVGDTFVMYGSIYPAGTIAAGLSGPDQAGSLGKWICRGIFNVDLATEAVPHAITNVLHVLREGLSATSAGVETAVDALVHEGFEGGYPVGRRAVVGGHGRFAGVRGETFQTYRGENETLIQLTPEIAVPASNYTFTFTLA